MKNRILLGSALGTVLIGTVLAVTVGGAFAHSTGATPLPAATCSAIQNPSGNLLIASDLPLQGSSRVQTIQMTKAIAFVLNQAGWKAGNYTVAYQSCDDSTAQAGKWDSATCQSNATNYAANASVVGVIGNVQLRLCGDRDPDRQPCGERPTRDGQPGEHLCRPDAFGPGAAVGEPQKYYPTGNAQLRARCRGGRLPGCSRRDAREAARDKSLYVINDKEAYGSGVATNTANAAKKLGIKIIKDTAYDPKATSFSALALNIKASGAQGVFIGGLICENGGKLVHDIITGDPGVKLILPDGFTPVSATVQQSGGTANGAYFSVAGLPNTELPASGQSFVKAFSKAEGGATVDPYSVYAASAAQVMLQAIGNSDGTRAGVNKALFKVSISNGYVGPISFNKNGDISENPVTIYKAVKGQSTTYKVIVPAKNLVASA